MVTQVSSLDSIASQESSVASFLMGCLGSCSSRLGETICDVGLVDSYKQSERPMSEDIRVVHTGLADGHLQFSTAELRHHELNNETAIRPVLGNVGNGP